MIQISGFFDGSQDAKSKDKRTDQACDAEHGYIVDEGRDGLADKLTGAKKEGGCQDAVDQTIGRGVQFSVLDMHIEFPVPNAVQHIGEFVGQYVQETFPIPIRPLQTL